jgi:predicted DCC family thiol-disulfide oxidoreductase YuxK
VVTIGLTVDKPRLVYDGVCNLCVGAVRFLNALDRGHAIAYTPYQILEAEWSRYGVSATELQGRIYVIQDDKIIKGAAAIAEACRLLAPITLICAFFDTPLAEKFYGFIARRRYKLFGCRESCYVPGP